MTSLFIKDFDKVVVSGTHDVVRPVRVVQLLKSDSISFETLGMCVKAVTKVHRGSCDRGLHASHNNTRARYVRAARTAPPGQGWQLNPKMEIQSTPFIADTVGTLN